MRVAVTGTPGTGKSSATDELDTDLEVVHLNREIKSRKLTSGYDDERESVITDIDAVAEWLDGQTDVVFESHLAHQFPADKVVVLRCHPEELESRLANRDESDDSILENAQSEALDVILAEAVSIHGEETVFEIDTTDRTVSEVSAAIADAIQGNREPTAGDVSFIDYLDK